MKHGPQILALILLAGCRQPEPDTKPLAGPVGRYQIVNGAGANLFIADTRDGKLWRCVYETAEDDTRCSRVEDLAP